MVTTTVVCDWESSRPLLCCKLPLFKTSRQTLKVVFCCFLSYVLIEYIEAFKWATFYYHSSRGCKTVTCQSWRSKKNLCLPRRPQSRGPSGRILFRLPTLIGHSFAAPWVTMTKSGSFESPKPYQLALILKNSIAQLLTSARKSWKVQIYYIT